MIERILFVSVFVLMTWGVAGQEAAPGSGVSGSQADLQAGAQTISQNNSQTVLPTDSLNPEEIAERIRTLEVLLDKNEKQAKGWWWTWVALYGSATVGQTVVALVSEDKPTRQDMWCSAGTTLLGVAGQLISPVKTSPATSACELERLLQMEDQLRQQASIAQAGKGWQMHALSGAVNLTSGLVTWLGYKRTFRDGLVNFALNTVVTEIQIWSQPVKARKNYRDYASRYGLPEAGITGTSSRNACEWNALVRPDGFTLAVTF